MQSKKRKITCYYKGQDSDLADFEEKELNRTLEMTSEDKFRLICKLSLLNYQLKNNTSDIPRFLRTTACIRKA